MKKNNVLIGMLAVLFSVFLFSQKAFANNNVTACDSNFYCTSVDDSLAEGVAGIDPANTVNLTFLVYQEADQQAPNCGSGKNLYNVVRHYIAGNATDYDYLSAGSGQIINYSFNSGVDQQVNRYRGVFYCSTASQGTSKAAIDSNLLVEWVSPEFNKITRAATVNLNCPQITSCSKYVVQRDCNDNRCNLSPACQWSSSSSSCLAQTGGGNPGGGGTPQNFSIENPIGIDNFEDLVNLIGVWIFNLSIPIAVIIIIYAGILMLTAGANPGQFKKGAEALKYAVIGLAIIFIGKGFVTLIQSILDLRNP